MKKSNKFNNNNYYWREYRAYYHIGIDWGVSESTVCRTVHKIENILIRSRKFSLPGKKSLLNSELDTDLIIMELGQVQLKPFLDKNSIIILVIKNSQSFSLLLDFYS